MRDFQAKPRWDFVNLSPENKIHPVKNPPMLAPCSPPAPPAHTQVTPRCFTCKHFEMCKYKTDYLKTATLIQNDLGDPALSYELIEHYITIPGFIGLPIINEKDYFPDEVIFDNSDNVGKFFGAKFNGLNYVNAVYKDKKYFVLIQLVYNKDSSLYELEKCQEAFYKVPYELNKDSLETIQLHLIQWREEMIERKIPEFPHPKSIDVINTTHFYAALECDLYEWNKESYKEAVERLNKKYPYGIPIDEYGRRLYHIETYHTEPYDVPFSPLYVGEEAPNKKPFFPPPPPPPKKPPKRRDDL